MACQNYFLPSEIARLVLGYLQESDCRATVKSFLKESKDLLEYSALLKRGIVYPTTIMGLTLIGIINDYGAIKLQEVGTNDLNSSFSSLWKQFDCVTKSLKEATKSKLRLPESQTSRTRRLNQKKKSASLKKECTKVSLLSMDEASDEEWVSDNERLKGKEKTPEIKPINASASRSTRKTRSSNTRQCGKRSSTARNTKSKRVVRQVLRSQPNAEETSTSIIEIDDSAMIPSPRSLSKSSAQRHDGNGSVESTSRKSVHDRNDVSINSVNLVINEESSDNNSMEATDLASAPWSPNCQSKKENGSQSCDVNKNKNDGTKLCSTDMDKMDESCFSQSEESVDKDMKQTCSDNHSTPPQKSCEMDKSENSKVINSVISQATSHSGQEHDQFIHHDHSENSKPANPLPQITPQKTCPPLIEESQLRTPVKSFNQQQSSDHHYRSPRRKRQPPKRRPERGKSPDQSSILPSSKIDTDENTVSDYPDILDRLLKDTKLHEKLAENINKNILPRKHSLDSSSSEVTVSKAVTVNTELSVHEKISNPAVSCSSTENANSISDVIKGIADITESDPSFNSLFNLFLNAKESSVHEEVDQMMVNHSHYLSQPTQSSQSAPQHATLHTPTPDDQYVNGVDDIQLSASNSQTAPVTAQQTSLQHTCETSQDRCTENNHNNNMNNNNNNTNNNVNNNDNSNQSQSSHHIGIKLNSQSIPNNDIINAVSSSSSMMNNSPYQPVSTNEVYPCSQSQQAMPTIQSVPRTVNQASGIMGIDLSVNIQSPAPSVISLASPDVCFVPTPERTNTTKRPKRITPIPLSGNEALSDVGKIASPQKPLVLVPAKIQTSNTNGFVICPNPVQYQESNSQSSQPVPAQSSVYMEPVADVQYVSDSYPSLSDADALSSSVCDIAVSPGGKNFTLHNKRSLKKAMEENHILSPITPINQNSQSSSSTPKDTSIPVSHYVVPVPLPEKSPGKKISKPNILSHSSRSPSINSKFPKNKNSMDFQSFKALESASVLQGSVDEQTFMAIPLGKLSKRMCHVRNLNFGPDALSVQKPPDEKPQAQTEKEKEKTAPSTDVSLTSAVEDGNQTVMSLQSIEPCSRVRPLKARNAAPIAIQKSTLTANAQAVTTSEETKEETSKTTPKTPVKQTSKKKSASKSRKKTKTELTKDVPLSEPVSDAISNIAAEETTLSKFSPLVPKKGKRRGQTSGKKKKDSESTKSSSVSAVLPVSAASAVPSTSTSATPVTIKAPAEIVDILDSDTKEFNKQLRLASAHSINESNVDNVSQHSTASTENLIGNSTPSQMSEDETKAAAEVLASLSRINYNQEIKSDKVKKGGKRKANEEKSDVISPSSTAPEKKKKKKTFDLKSVDIDALLAKVKY